MIRNTHVEKTLMAKLAFEKWLNTTSRSQNIMLVDREASDISAYQATLAILTSHYEGGQSRVVS